MSLFKETKYVCGNCGKNSPRGNCKTNNSNNLTEHDRIFCTERFIQIILAISRKGAILAASVR
jgi:DNA-directed RNA polymerase subunit RPC12/RpoP